MRFKIPKNATGFLISQNPHEGVGQSLEDYFGLDLNNPANYVSEDEMKAVLETRQIWVAMWFTPECGEEPMGISAASLEMLLRGIDAICAAENVKDSLPVVPNNLLYPLIITGMPVAGGEYDLLADNQDMGGPGRFIIGNAYTMAGAISLLCDRFISDPHGATNFGSDYMIVQVIDRTDMSVVGHWLLHTGSNQLVLMEETNHYGSLIACVTANREEGMAPDIMHIVQIKDAQYHHKNIQEMPVVDPSVL